MAWLAQQNVPVLYWVGQSPDQNPIENLWREWKRIIMTQFRLLRNLQELHNRFFRFWVRTSTYSKRCEHIIINFDMPEVVPEH